MRSHKLLYLTHWAQPISFPCKNCNISNVQFKRRHKTIQSIDNGNGNRLGDVAMAIAMLPGKNAPCKNLCVCVFVYFFRDFEEKLREKSNHDVECNSFTLHIGISWRVGDLNIQNVYSLVEEDKKKHIYVQVGIGTAIRNLIVFAYSHAAQLLGSLSNYLQTLHKTIPEHTLFI